MDQATRGKASNTGLPAPADAAQLEAILAAHADSEGALLPVLHAVQETFGYVPAAAVAPIAEALNLSKAEVTGVVSFYHDFRDAPAGRHVLKLCRAEACQAMGGRGLAERALRRLGIGWGGTTANGALTVEAVYCLGLCAIAPAALLDGEPVARLDGPALDVLCARAEAP
ncbi:MAG: formate dehydrogenase subunit gamma [Proteobacteria bacterium]|nr:formate dehydrogenase subunit gamma [Pseudomonadota bacterium]